MVEAKAKYGDPRRTQIVRTKGSDDLTLTPLTAIDIAPVKDAWIVVTQDGHISRTPTMRLPRMSGRAAPKFIIRASGRDILYLFDEKGSGVAIPVHVIPEVDQPTKGIPINSVSPFGSGINLAAGIALPPAESTDVSPERYLILCTKKGMLKKSKLAVIPGPSTKSFTAINIGKGDALGWACMTGGNDEIILVSRKGMAIRFSEKQIRPTGLSAAGVMGMKIEDSDDQLVGMDKILPRGELLLVTENGLAKRIGLSQFPKQGRYGKGVLAWKSGEGILLAGAAVGLSDHRSAVMFSNSASRSLRFADVVRRNRATAGRTVFDLAASDRVIGLVPVISRSQVAKGKKISTRAKKASARSKTTTRRRSRSRSTTKKSGTRSASRTSKKTR